MTELFVGKPLVEFGMKDVEETIAKKMTELDKGSRSDLSNLTSTYLRDVILGDYQKTDLSEFDELDDPTIDAIFNRIDQSVLPKAEKQSLRESIKKIKIDPDFRDKDRVVVHFLTKLIDFYKKLQEKEKSVQEFVDVCNQYLTGKKFVYDKINFDISIQLEQLYQTTSPNLDRKANSRQALKMSKLSSGEKQIVSLFSQIYLSGSSSYFLIIDEPELSLSVLWQKRFLPDILNTKRCNGLIAATHSPFIFDNQLDEYAHSLDQFMELLDAEN
jgi:predicted ATP-dependent endonuclease of OLD family